MNHTIGRSLATLILACVTGLAPGTLVRGDGPPAVELAKLWLPDMKVETYKLENGLTVTLHEDHNTPLVAVHVTYNAGSKDDPPGRSGLAHLFEHLMFEGSEHSDSSYYWPIYPYVADARGATGRDRTDYHATVTRNALERTLWLEADRMGFLMPAVTDDRLSNARNVVANERRQTLDELPLAEVEEAWSRELYPPGHPYRRLIIGSLDDVAAATLTDLKRFSERHYAPDNACLCLAGDFEPARAKRLIKKYFGPLRSGPPAAAVPPIVPALAEPRKIALTDRVSHAHVLVVWPTVPANHPDEAALDVLATVLGGDSRWNRLFRSMIYDHQIAISANAYHPTHLLAGTFEVDLFARIGQNLEELVRRADTEIERLKSEGPTADEVHRVQIERVRQQGMELDSVTRKARVLNHSAAAHGDPLGYRSVLDRIFRVTPEDVRRVARAYLGPGRIELTVTPGPRAVNRAQADPAVPPLDPPVAARAGAHDDGFDRSITPNVGSAVAFDPPLIKRRRLSNGLELRIVERHQLPTVKLTLVVMSGATAAPRGKDGLSLLTVKLLEEGTKSRTTFQLERELIDKSAIITTEGLMDSSSISLTTLTGQLAPALDLYADVVLHPAFADTEYLRVKIARLAEIEDRADNAEQIAEDVLPGLLYHPEHPYARARLGTVDSVRALTREDVIEFYERHYVPGNASLVVVGDVETERITADLEARFGRWAPGPIPPPPALPRSPWPTAEPGIYLIDKPGATQSVISVGRIAASINSPDRQRLLVLNENLKGHVNTTLRDDRADTYGFSSTIDFRNDLGPFVLTGSVPTSRTAQTLATIFKEMNDLAGTKPITEEELTTIRKAMVPEWINRFETINDIAAEVAFLASHHLPDDHFALEPDRFEAVTQSDVDWLARHLLTPRWMTVLVVGDRSRIEKSLRDVPLGKPIRLLDTSGKPVRKHNAATWPPDERIGKATTR
jgi:zinc protease